MKSMLMLYASQRDYDEMAGRAHEGEAVRTAGEPAAPVHTRRFGAEDGGPVVTDGPYPETAEVLAGYTIIDCASHDRACEIAARLAQGPAPAAARDSAYADLRPIIDGGAELQG